MAKEFYSIEFFYECDLLHAKVFQSVINLSKYKVVLISELTSNKVYEYVGNAKNGK